ncbi:GNAT family N-acetyltransferase [Anaeromyxobacter paludicola]|uniref:Phosphinothricin acetyltransferase n=1 Tax=Anaeromyxobacter paludicola TaxID=2918171 RepID=A0ABM7XDR9_9BACT|nr:GNAT family N-acetyltransferase [Anaeromyxobacter paludicola]BDG09957.1 phosphinothricin acetyltransferase [Anaeromyxobacter paludicola]
MIRDAALDDLPRIVEIYNASIPGRLATADLEPVSVAQRTPWFQAHHPARRPLWVLEEDGRILGWVSLQDFYGRCAYSGTAEVSIYVAPEAARRGVARTLLGELLARAPSMAVKNLVAFVFGHNEPSLALFRRHGFERWGFLPRVALLDGVERDLAILGLRLG